MMIVGLVKALDEERYSARAGERTTAPAEPWIVAETTDDPRDDSATSTTK
jgi:choline/glycine/proline betaine transport protein